MMMAIIFGMAFLALCASVWALGAAQAAWRRSAPKVAQGPSEGWERPLPEVPTVEERVQMATDLADAIKADTVPDLALNFRCNSCRQIRRVPPEFLTQIDLDMPFLDSTLPIHVYICKECLGGA